MPWSVDGNTEAHNGSNVARGFLSYGGELYMRAGGGGGLYHRVGAGNWSRIQLAAGPIYGRGTACVWNSLLWEVGTDNKVYRSNDGSTWIVDLDITATWGTTSPGYGLGSYQGASNLYLVHVTAGVIFYFASRSLGGVWTNNVATARPSPVTNTQGIIGFGGDIFCSSFFGLERWDGVSWNEDSVTGLHFGPFPYHDGTIFANASVGGGNLGLYRWTGSDWVQEGTASNGISSYYSIGTDGLLYIAGGIPGAVIYRRNDATNTWTALDSYNGVTDGGTCATHFGNDRFFCERSTLGDDIYIRDVTPADPYTIHPPVGGGAGEGIAPQAIDVDGNGDIMYIGLYNASDNPMLIRVPLPLAIDSQGNLIYDPADGDTINVNASKYVSDFFITSGYFGDNVQTHQSDDGGDSLIQIDPGNWAANRAQPIALDPNDEGHVLVALHTRDDLMEYTGSGTSWTLLDDALAFDVGAMAMYDLNTDEIFIGRDAAGADVILYSPNNGVGGWEDITLLMTSPGAIANIEVV